MSVTLTLALPDLRPDTIRAAFGALLPPVEPVEAPVLAEVILLEKDLELPAEPEPALLRAARAAIAEGAADGMETSVSTSWQGLPRVNVAPRDFQRICRGMTATVAYGGWTVVRDGVEWVSFLGDTSGSSAVVPPPEADVPDDAPPAADEVVF